MGSINMFKTGFAEACRSAGFDDWESVFPDVESHYELYSLNPDKFMEGFSAAVKEAQALRPAPQNKSWLEDQMDDMSWEKAKKWLIGAGLLALGAGYGSMWGRYANATGNKRGPILGPILGVRDTVRDVALGSVARGMSDGYSGERQEAAGV